MRLRRLARQTAPSLFDASLTGPQKFFSEIKRVLKSR